MYFEPIRKSGVARMATVKVTPAGVYGQLNVDFAPDGRLLGIEVLGASTMLPISLLDRLRKP
jgi:uncharacterized protein YuzE